MAEEKEVEKRNAIIQRFLQRLIESDPQLYYAPTSQIAREIYTDLRDRLNTLDFEEQILVKRLGIKDIEVILSYR